MPETYDNNNRASLWKSKVAAEGTAKIENVEYRTYLQTINATGDKVPAAIMFFVTTDRALCFHAALWRKTDGKPGHLWNGSVIVASGRAYWIHVFKVTSDNPKAPALNVSFQEKQARPAMPQQAFDASEEYPTAEPDENIPF